MSTFSQADGRIVQTIKQTLKREADSLLSAIDRVDHSFVQAVTLILESQGKVVVSGLGKSGHVGRKISSTLASTGSSSVFLHPSEALHGDFGIVQSADVILAIAFGGETEEVCEVARFARRSKVPVISITGNKNSTLAALSDVVLDGSVAQEACPLRLAPTSSSTLAMAIGDALAMALMDARGFKSEDFAALHPGGRLGRKLAFVHQHMHTGDKVPIVSEDADFHAILATITANNFGIVGVVDKSGKLVGCITDGDVRRSLLNLGAETLDRKARDYAQGRPKTVSKDALAIDAVNLMEDKPKCTALFVTEPGEDLPIGIVRIHDILQAKII